MPSRYLGAALASPLLAFGTVAAAVAVKYRAHMSSY